MGLVLNNHIQNLHIVVEFMILLHIHPYIITVLKQELVFESDGQKYNNNEKTIIFLLEC